MINNIAVYFSSYCDDPETVHPEDIWTLEIATCKGDMSRYSVSFKGAAMHVDIANGLRMLANHIETGFPGTVH
jgi:hypothetical protein